MLYLERQNYLCETASRELDGLLELKPAPAGTHLVGFVPPGAQDAVWAGAAAAADIETIALSNYYLRRVPRGGLILGYAAYGREATRSAIQKLGKALRPLATGRALR
jgi:GntR family transcriptional regulator/MocR family aminotransferase